MHEGLYGTNSSRFLGYVLMVVEVFFAIARRIRTPGAISKIHIGIAEVGFATDSANVTRRVLVGNTLGPRLHGAMSAPHSNCNIATEEEEVVHQRGC